MLTEQPWLYGKGSGFEILSACNEQATTQFARTLVRLRADIGQFLPRSIPTLSGLPATYVIIPKDFRSSIDQRILDGATKNGSPVTAKPVRDILLTDPDSVFFLIELDEAKDLVHQVTLINTSTYIQFLLGLHRPRLPPWLIVGIVGVYDTILLPWPSSGFGPEPWLSQANARTLRRDSLTPKPVVPLDELFLPGYPAEKTAEYRKVWRAEAELFVRWSLAGKTAEDRSRLWTFAEATAAQPPSEALFQSIFGINYSDGRDVLSDFLPHAVGDHLESHAEEVSETPPIGVEEATTPQRRRIIGELARRCMSVARIQDPDQATVYTKHAQDLLEHSYNADPKDTEVAASWALFLLETGDVSTARKVLAGLMEDASVRPLIRLEWARLKLRGAVQAPDGPSGYVSEAQARAVLDLLKMVQDAGLPDSESYDLEAELLEHLQREPTDNEIARLYRGSVLFADDAPLVLRAASWLLRRGQVRAARDRIQMGLWENAGTPLRPKFELLDRLANGTPIPDGQIQPSP